MAGLGRHEYMLVQLLAGGVGVQQVCARVSLSAGLPWSADARVSTALCRSLHVQPGGWHGGWVMGVPHCRVGCPDAARACGCRSCGLGVLARGCGVALGVQGLCLLQV